MTKQIVFWVTDEVAAEMEHRSVYLDVFGHVRWVDTGAAIPGSGLWGARSV